MGCAAGKRVTTTPEVSSSPSSSNPNIKKENGWTSHKHEIPKQTMESSTNSRKDSCSSTSSVKEPDIPEPTGDQAPKASKPNDGLQAKRLIQLKELNNKAPKAVPLGQLRQELSSSQIEFFRMLDKKIEEGPDYLPGNEP